jgi:hypothetical protein
MVCNAIQHSVCLWGCHCVTGVRFFFNFDLLHVPLLEVILHALFHIYSYSTMLSSSSYILYRLDYLSIIMLFASLSKEILLINLTNG